MNELIDELKAWLKLQNINSSNIGIVRRQLMVPWNSKWNAIVRDLTAQHEKNENIILEPQEVRQLEELLNSVCDGTEHGVITYTAWKNKCQELVKFMKEHNMTPSGQWTL